MSFISRSQPVITPPAPKMAYSYVRFSHEKQAQGDSVRRQTAAAREYASRHGLTLDETVTYEDLGVSAFTGENRTAGMLGAFLQAVNDKTVKAGSLLIIENFDRLSRQGVRQTMNILNQLVDAGIEIATLSDGRRYTAKALDEDPMAIFAVVLTAMRAADESRMKSGRVKAAWSERKAKAKASGYVIAELAPGWVQRVDMDERKGSGRFVLIPERAAAVQRMVDLFLSGAGLHSVARTLNQERVQCFGGGRQWWDDGVRRILDNPAIAGVLNRPGAEGVEGYYPQVVSLDQWKDLQALRTGRRLPNHRVQTGMVNPLAGLAKCCLCGKPLTRILKGKKEAARLVCTAAKVGAGCEYHSVRLDALEDALRRDLPMILAEAPSGNDQIDSEVQELRGQLDGTDDQLGRLIDALRQHGPSAAISESLTALEAHKRATEAELREAEERASAASPRAVERRREDLLDALDSGATAGELNVKLRGVFEALIPDHSTGRMALRWIGGQACDREVMFAWREAED